jgi:serine/threonine protein kinase
MSRWRPFNSGRFVDPLSRGLDPAVSTHIMKDFRAALEDYLAGRLEAPVAQARMTEAVRRSPQLAPAMLATIEAFTRSGRATPEIAASLNAIVKAAAASASARPAPPAVPTPPSDKTQFRPAGAPAAPPAAVPPSDKTQFRPAGAPAAAPPSDKTQFRPVSGSKAPPPAEPSAPADRSHSPPTTGTSSSQIPRSPTSTRGTSAGSWTDFAQAGGVPTLQLTIGSILADRYVLDSIVAGGDKGGMGVVYKALDLRQQEAQERHPYVAIKVLNEDFKRHPDSIKALARETTKTRKLSHPNIISVYDFNRDGGNVFMAMELLEGSALNDLIRNYRDRGGVPLNEAMRIIRGLGSGLAHAHANGIVHSDFKPSNSFLTTDNRVKILDFGIARAAKVGAGAAAGGDKTLFDAGTLGALTMPYASCEQIDGADPDTADDVYALAVVSYELLTGRHPFERADPDKQGQFEKTDAAKARQLKMKPAAVPGLARSQWHTLQRALAFNRAERPKSAEEFLEGMAPKKKPIGAMIGGGAALLILIIMAALLLPSYIERGRLQTISERLQSSDADTVAKALDSVRAYPPEKRNSVLLNEAVQSKLFAYFNRRARAAFDVSSGKFDFKTAVAALKEAQGLSKAYEDSRQLTESIDQLETERKTEILRQAERFETLLKDGTLIPSQGPDNAQRALAIIAQLDPTHPLLNDKRLPIAYTAQSRIALAGGKVDLADQLLTAGLRLAPSDPNLLDLQDRIGRLHSEAQLAARVGDLEKQAAPLAAASARLEDFRARRDVLTQLRRLAAGSPALSAALERLEALINAEVAAASQQRQMGGAQALVGEFADVLPEKFVGAQRAAIVRVIGEAQARENTIQQLRTAIAAEVAAPLAEDGWVAQFQRSLKNLEALGGPNDPTLRDARQKTAQAFFGQAQSLRTAQRLSESERVLALAKQFGLSADQAATESAALAQVRSALETETRAREAQAQMSAAKQRVLDQALADHAEVAESLFAELQKKLPAGDNFVTTDAPHALGSAYVARAQRAVALGRFDEALPSVNAALRVAPQQPDVQAAAQRMLGAVALAHQLASDSDLAPLKPALEKLRGTDRAAFAPVERGLLRVVTDRLSQLGARNPAGAMQLRAGAVQLFPGAPLPTFQISAPAAPAPARETATAARPPTPAPAPVTTARPTETAPPPVEAPPAAPPPITVAAAPSPAAAPAAAPTVASSTAPAAATLRPCVATLAGLGQNSRASCRDALPSNGRGPEMVVIAAASGLPIFAIARNETSVAEYAAYCAASGCTSPAGATPEVPITTVPVSAAEKYAAWLSAATGAKYRLPTEAEWHLAAGNAPDTKANCLVTVNGQAIRGTALRPADVGDLNAQGLRHVVGNAQEWVSAGSGWKAMGGAIGDPIDVCSSSLARAHNGAPDGKTGFRLVREMR